MRNLELKTTGMEFASEMIVRSALENIRIQEVPTTLVKDGRSRPPHLHTWRDGWRHLKFLLMHNPFWLFFVPGIFFLLIGVVIVGTLFTGPMKLGVFNLDLNTYTFGCFMSIVGIQLIVSTGVTYQYAFSTGILPPTNRLKAINQHLTTDRLVFIGAIAIALGIGIFFVAISQWASVNFGDLVIDKASRIVILALSILVIGIQLFFSGFLIGILQIQSKRQ
jgi:hypothetical protein